MRIHRLLIDRQLSRAMRSRSRDGPVRPSGAHVSLAEEIRRDSRGRSCFSRRRAFHCSSSRVPVSPAAPCRKPERLEDAGENSGVCTVQVRRRRNRGENSRLFSPLSPLLAQRSCRFARRRSHAAIECRFFPLFPRCPLVRVGRSPPEIYPRCLRPERKRLLSFSETMRTRPLCARVPAWTVRPIHFDRLDSPPSSAALSHREAQRFSLISGIDRFGKERDDNEMKSEFSGKLIISIRRLRTRFVVRPIFRRLGVT